MEDTRMAKNMVLAFTCFMSVDIMETVAIVISLLTGMLTLMVNSFGAINSILVAGENFSYEV